MWNHEFRDQMTTSKIYRVCFIQVMDNASKLKKLCDIVQTHFLKKDVILITAPSIQAAEYIDQLLWRSPEESFIPHAIVSHASKEKIAITTSPSNVNQANVLINLLAVTHPNPGLVDVIYELLDLTSQDKIEVARQKREIYMKAGHQIMTE